MEYLLTEKDVASIRYNIYGKETQDSNWVLYSGTNSLDIAKEYFLEATYKYKYAKVKVESVETKTKDITNICS